MALRMRTSEAGLELIKSFEGFRSRATRMPNGKWIIGYGHTDGARKGLTVTPEDADLLLRHHDLRKVEALIADRV
ncbi:MAG: glycoside hydrolase, partial [Hyphomonas sp.]|nr:glycoside hydrolase [Hyphomonas sp.]